MDSRTVELFWNHPAGKHDKYKISYTPIPDPNSPVQLKFAMEATIEYVSGSQTKFQMQDLTPGTRYEAEIYSVVGQKESIPQRLLFATIPEDPVNVVATALSANRVKVGRFLNLFYSKDIFRSPGTTMLATVSITGFHFFQALQMLILR